MLKESKVCICFLVVNDVLELPKLAISSALATTDKSVQIYVGYIYKNDCASLPLDNRIQYLDLGNSSKYEINREFNGKYSAFDREEFYQIVQLKWSLIQKTLDEKFDFIVYSDTDVIWLKDPIMSIEKAFKKYEEIELFTQSDTRSIDYLVPCMGFVAIRNSKRMKLLIEECKELHELRRSSNKYIGDDEIMKEILEKYHQPEWFRELPQMTFPIGAMYGLFKRKLHFPNLLTPEPYIFHANYVNGLVNKRMLLRLVMGRKNRKTYKMKFSFSFILKMSLNLAKVNIRNYFG